MTRRPYLDERWVETPTGLVKCPNCYPVEVAS